MRKGFASLFIFIVIAVGILVSTAAYLKFKSGTTDKPQLIAKTIESTPTPQTSPNPLTNSTTEIDSSSKDYNDTHYANPGYLSKTNQSTSYITDIDSNWKAYTNKQFHFTLHYPSNYDISEIIKFDYNPDSLYVFGLWIRNSKPTTGGGYQHPHVNVFIYKKDPNNLTEWIDKHTSTLPVAEPSIPEPSQVPFVVFYDIKDKSTSKLDDKAAITFTSSFRSESSSKVTIADSGNNIVSVSFANDNETRDPDLKNYYPTILSTFKFIN